MPRLCPTTFFVPATDTLLGVAEISLPIVAADVLLSERIEEGVGGVKPNFFTGVTVNLVRSSSKDRFSFGCGASWSTARIGDTGPNSWPRLGEPERKMVSAGLSRAASKSAPVRRRDRLDEVDGLAKLGEEGRGGTGERDRGEPAIVWFTAFVREGVVGDAREDCLEIDGERDNEVFFCRTASIKTDHLGMPSQQPCFSAIA